MKLFVLRKVAGLRPCSWAAASAFLAASFIAGSAQIAPAHAQSAPDRPSIARSIKAGEFIVDPPTLINLGFEWAISGDSNRNARVEVSYRKKGTKEWKKAMPLMRIQGEQAFWGNEAVDDHLFKIILPDMFAGSILDLESDTTYEAKFTLSDPDGITGVASHRVTVKTRAEPKPATGGNVYHVYPPDWKGPKEPKSYVGFNCGYNYHCDTGGDASLSDRPRVRPGDVILVHAGVYQSYRDRYTSPNRARPVEGTYYLSGSGTPDKPIVIKAAGDGEVIFDGGGNFNLFNVQRANYNYFEGITFRNTEIAILAGVQFIAGSSGLTVKRSRFENVSIGINTSWSGSKNFYIADNYFIGRDDPNHLQAWSGAFWNQFNGVDGQTFPARLNSYTAVRVTGQGHVIAYNYVANFHDGIDTETYGNPDGSDAVHGPYYPPRSYYDRRPVSIDYLNNYMTNFHDNAFEVDGSMHNIRVMRNMVINSGAQPFCNQPDLGGPVYWVRNIAYNAPGGAVRLEYGSPGVMFLNNTLFSEFQAEAVGNLHVLNNLILGENAILGTGDDLREKPPIFSVTSFTNYDQSDYNGFRPNPGAKTSFEWNSPADGLSKDYQGFFTGTHGPSDARLVRRKFESLANFSAAMHHDQHSIIVDYGDFENVKPLDGRDPKTVQNLYKAEDFDFRLKSASAPVDKGTFIPNVTDAYNGLAPDLGALEVGMPTPHYGPRPEAP